jgi:hypothetical protein
MAVIVITKTCLVLGALLEIVSYHQSEFHKKFDGVVECCPTHPEILGFHFALQFLEGKMSGEIKNGIKDGISLWSFPHFILLEIIGEREPHLLHHTFVHIGIFGKNRTKVQKNDDICFKK